MTDLEKEIKETKTRLNKVISSIELRRTESVGYQINDNLSGKVEIASGTYNTSIWVGDMQEVDKRFITKRLTELRNKGKGNKGGFMKIST